MNAAKLMEGSDSGTGSKFRWYGEAEAWGGGSQETFNTTHETIAQAVASDGRADDPRKLDLVCGIFFPFQRDSSRICTISNREHTACEPRDKLPRAGGFNYCRTASSRSLPIIQLSLMPPNRSAPGPDANSGTIDAV